MAFAAVFEAFVRMAAERDSKKARLAGRFDEQ
jgi:hypothetical protein